MRDQEIRKRYCDKNQKLVRQKDQVEYSPNTVPTILKIENRSRHFLIDRRHMINLIQRSSF
jgi:hypothetical protein